MKGLVKFSDKEIVKVRVEVSKWQDGHGYIYRDDVIAREEMPFEYALPEFENIIGDAEYIENELAKGLDYQVTFVIYRIIRSEEIDIAKASCWVSKGLEGFEYEPCDNIAVIWEAACDRDQGDRFCTVHGSYDEAVSAARYDLAYSTKSERAKETFSVESRTVDLSDPDIEDLPADPSVEDVYRAAIIADVYPIDPETYEVIE